MHKFRHGRWISTNLTSSKRISKRIFSKTNETKRILNLPKHSARSQRNLLLKADPFETPATPVSSEHDRKVHIVWERQVKRKHRKFLEENVKFFGQKRRLWEIYVWGFFLRDSVCIILQTRIQKQDSLAKTLKGSKGDLQRKEYTQVASISLEIQKQQTPALTVDSEKQKLTCSPSQMPQKAHSQTLPTKHYFRLYFSLSHQSAKPTITKIKHRLKWTIAIKIVPISHLKVRSEYF